MKQTDKELWGIPKRTRFHFLDENGNPLTKVWIYGPFVLYRNYTKDCFKRAFGEKRIVLLRDVRNFLYMRSIPDGRNMKEAELAVYGLDAKASHWEIVKALGGKSMSDGCSIYFPD